MIFNSWVLALFAPVIYAVYWLIPNWRLRACFLIVAGAVFYGASVLGYLAVILTLAIVTYGTSQYMLTMEGGSARSRYIFAVGIVLIAGTLVAFKYSHFFALTINEVARFKIIPVPSLVVPLAISFFTFEFVHVLSDVYSGRIQRIDPLSFAVFAMFFPTMVAGPIKRYQTFAPQIQHANALKPEDLMFNVYRIAIGLAKKTIVADSMTAFTGPLSGASLPYGRIDYLVAILAYTVKIYFDFSAYSDIAIGLSGILGYRIQENFDRPYRASNIAEFWRRWHISLSTWIRDYVFIPLGGSRRPGLVTALNLIVAMALAGLWHGAAWTFVLWGLWHGCGLAIHRLWRGTAVAHLRILQRPSHVIEVISTFITFAFVGSGWILFAALNAPAAWNVVAHTCCIE